MTAFVLGVAMIAGTLMLTASVNRSFDRIFVEAADPELLRTLEGEMAAGRFLDRASERYPAIVLGAKAAAIQKSA